MLLAAALLVFLAPIVVRGLGAFVFRGTIEYRRLMLEKFDRGDVDAVEAEQAEAAEARRPVYEMLAAFEKELADGRVARRGEEAVRADRRNCDGTRACRPTAADAQAELDRREAELDRRGEQLAKHEASLANWRN